MSELFVRNIPSIQRQEYKYRGRMDSHLMNEHNVQIFNDILDLFNKANQLQKNVYEMNLTANIEAACYEQRLEDTIKRLNQLDEVYHNLTAADNDFRTQTRYAYEATTDDDDYGAVIDKNSNTVVPHIVSSRSKTKVYDATYDETHVPVSLQAYIGPDSFRVGGEIFSIEDSDIMNAFDGKSDTCWFRKVITTTNVEYIDNEIVIGLPEDIITTRMMNQISIRTFPAGYLDILDVQYKSNGAWTQIPGFTSHSGYQEKTALDIFNNTYTYGVIENASDLKFSFMNVQTNQIKIKMRQKNYTYDAENNRRIWYLGLRDIDVVYNMYTNEHSEFDLVYKFPELDKNIKIYDVEVRTNNENISDDKEFGITKEYFYFDSDGFSHKIASTVPFILEGHKMRVKFTIEGGQIAPNVYSATVKYKLS